MSHVVNNPLGLGFSTSSEDRALQAFVDKFRYNAKRASLVQSRIKAIERLGEVDVVEDDPEYIFK